MINDVHQKGQKYCHPMSRMAKRFPGQRETISTLSRLRTNTYKDFISDNCEYISHKGSGRRKISRHPILIMANAGGDVKFLGDAIYTSVRSLCTAFKGIITAPDVDREAGQR